MVFPKRFWLIAAAALISACGSSGSIPTDASEDGSLLDLTPAAKTGVVINEISCKGDDWVELYNNGPDPVDISGWFLSDNQPGQPDDMEGFPDGTIIEPGSFLVLYRADALQFKIKCGEETVTLTDAYGVLVDAMSPGPLFDSQSWGLIEPERLLEGVVRPTAGTPNEQTPLMTDDAPNGATPPPSGQPGVCGDKSDEWGALVCADTKVSDAQFLSLSIPENFRVEVSRVSKFMAPAFEDPELVPPLVQNVALFALHEDFLSQVFSEFFPELSPQTYDTLFAARATREYFAGALYQFADESGYGFTVVTDPLEEDELLNSNELISLRDTLTAMLEGADLVYVPTSAADETRVLAWTDPPVPYRILEPTSQTDGQITYTSGSAYGWIRIFDQSGLELALQEGLVGWNDIIVVDQPPADLEVIVAGIITGAPQTELSHVTIRTSRRGTPNIYLLDATSVLQDLEGALVRFDSYPGAYVLSEDVSLEEAQAFWAENRPNLGPPPQLDSAYDAFPNLNDVPVGSLADRDVAIRRFGGKGAGLATLYSALSDTYQLPGFLIPFHWYETFIDTNMTTWKGQELSYRALFAAWAQDELFMSDLATRRSVLEAFKEDALKNATLPEGLELSLIERIEQVFGDTDVMVRFRSSSNAEDALEFSGAGLYDSTSVCAADSLYGDLNIPSACDPNTADERTIRRGLVKVWTSLWNFRAFEERSYVQIPQEGVSMAILVNLRMIHERANGVLLTGLPDGPPAPSGTHRYLVNAQWGDVEVVLPESGVVPERLTLNVHDQEVTDINRISASNLIPAEYVVLPYSWAKMLGDVVASTHESFPVDHLGDIDPSRVLLDLEWKFDKDGQLFIKQIRPFLVPEETTPEGVLFTIPTQTPLCSSYVDDRSIWRERKLRTRIDLNPLSVLLPFDMDAYPITMDLAPFVEFSPSAAQLESTESGQFTLTKTTTWQDVYTFEFTQAFALGDDLVHLRWKQIVTTETGGVPPGSITVVDDGSPGFSACIAPCAGANDDIPLRSCTMTGLDLWTHHFTFDDPSAPFQEVSIQVRHREEPVESGPLRIQKAQMIRQDGSILVIDSFFDMAYSTQRHNRSEDFLFTVQTEDGKQFILLDEPDLLEEPTASLKLFDETVSPLGSYTTTEFGKAPE